MHGSSMASVCWLFNEKSVLTGAGVQNSSHQAVATMLFDSQLVFVLTAPGIVLGTLYASP